MKHACDGGKEEISTTGWQARFFEKIGQSATIGHPAINAWLTRSGLGDMVKADFEQLGGIPGKNGLILTAGQPVGEGLSAQAAEELGLVAGTPVGSGVIDALVVLSFDTVYMAYGTQVCGMDRDCCCDFGNG
jgi:ribulose kinase